MAKQTVDPGVREALWDLQRYLSDEVAPMAVTGSIGVLLRCPPQVAAGEILGWLTSQRFATASSPPVADCLFHAIKKLHLMAEFDLIDKEPFDGYLNGLGEIVLRFCPEQDRQDLAERLGGLRQPTDRATASPRIPAATAAVVAREGVQDPAVVIQGIGPVALLASNGQALNLAAFNASNGAEFDKHVKRLRELGFEVEPGDVFRSLGAGLPGWDLPAGVDPPPNRAVEAMYRLISTTNDPAAAANRLVEMLYAAIEQFNAGNFVQAQTMFKLANRIIDEKKLDANVIESFKQHGYEAVAIQRLHELSRQSLRFPVLRTILEFFPAFSPEVLLRALRSEASRDRRLLQLALLEVYGETARSEVLDRFGMFCGDLTNDPHGYFQRNLIFLLRRIERSDNGKKELDLLVRSSELDQPPIVIREAVDALAAWKHDRAERTLTQRLDQIEAVMSGTDDTIMAHGQLVALLDRTVAALGAYGTVSAMRAVVAHGFSRRRALGDTMSRLTQLGSCDLSVDKELVDRLIRALRRRLPTRVLGFMVQKKSSHLIGLVRALGATPSPRVQSLMEQIVERFPNHDLAAHASDVLEGFSRVKAPAEFEGTNLSGDIDLFSLPNLLGNLCDSKRSGKLTLIDRAGKTFATLQLDHRQLLGCATASLSGEPAFYQLFEKPTPGTFAFMRGQVESCEGQPIELMPAILEALRRHDEFTVARTVVPDDATLTAGDVKPTSCEGEGDLTFMRSVWVKASSGTTAEKCEVAIASDAYRIRRLYAHWVKTGALRPA